MSSDACLSEEMVDELRRCIRTDLDCAEHADMHDHCRICAEACRRCQQACEELLLSIG